MEGREEGRQEGIVRVIHLCERWLKRSETPIADLVGLSLEELTRLADDLQAQVDEQR